MEKWAMVAVALFGVLAQLWVAAKRNGADDQKLKQHGLDIVELQTDVKGHSERISKIEGQLEVRHGGRI